MILMTKKNTINGAQEMKGVYQQTSWDPIVFFLFKEPNTSEFEIKCYAIFPRSQGTHKKTFKTLKKKLFNKKKKNNCTFYSIPSHNYKPTVDFNVSWFLLTRRQ